MLASEIIYSIKNLKSGGKTSDDSQISDSQWMFIINQYRSQLIRQQQNAGQQINQELIQKINPTKITLTQSVIDKCEYTTQAIPQFIELHKANASTYVGTEDGLSYQRTNFNKSIWDKHSNNKNFKKWYELGNKIVVRNHKVPHKLLIMGLFENPQAVVEFNGELNEMKPFDFEYPMSNTMVDAVIKMIADSEMKLSLMLAQDNLNNGKEDIKAN